MFRFIIPTILIGVAVIAFLMFTNPLYREMDMLRGQMDSYNEALANSKMLENERDKLTKKYNAITPENLERLSKFLPSNVDNIRLILEIEKIAGPYGMVLRDVKYQSEREQEPSPQEGVVVQEITENENQNYGSWDLEFSTQGSYANFVSFLNDLERNLRMVDVSSIKFSSGAPAGGLASNIYKYSFKIKTYWLKD